MEESRLCKGKWKMIIEIDNQNVEKGKIIMQLKLKTCKLKALAELFLIHIQFKNCKQLFFLLV